MRRRGRLLLVATVTGLLLWGSSAYGKVVEPDHEMPFPCAQKWTGTTRSTHTPSSRAIDFNRTDDLGDPVVASAPGVVTKVLNLGSRSYGLHVVVDHGDGRSSLYAHLSSAWVVPGQVVDQSTILGLVGQSGNVTGPHLHFEERVDGTDVPARFHGVAYVMGTTQASANCPDVPVTGDWDGDGRAQLGVFRRGAKASFLRATTQGTTTLTYGRATDEPVTGDWNGDGTTDPGVRRWTTNAFYLRRPSGTSQRVVFGQVGDRPLAGDWDGDGKDDIGVYRPSTATFVQRYADGETTSVKLGTAGMIPVTGDWNGDRKTDLGTFEPATGTWTLRYTDAEGTSWTASVVFGSSSDLPVTGDWDGDGRANLGTWTPGTATYSLRTGASATAGARATTQRFGRAR